MAFYKKAPLNGQPKWLCVQGLVKTRGLDLVVLSFPNHCLSLELLIS